jgi:hypothetical protein
VIGNFHAQFLEGWTGAIPSGYSVLRPELTVRFPERRLGLLSSQLGPDVLTVPFQRDCTLRALSARARNSAMFWSLAAWYAHPSAVAFQR